MILASMPGVWSEGARLAFGNSGAGSFSNGTYMVVGILILIGGYFFFKNFNKIGRFIFFRKPNRDIFVETGAETSTTRKDTKSVHPGNENDAELIRSVELANEKVLSMKLEPINEGKKSAASSKSASEKRQPFYFSHLIFKWSMLLLALAFVVTMVALISM